MPMIMIVRNDEPVFQPAPGSNNKDPKYIIPNSIKDFHGFFVCGNCAIVTDPNWKYCPACGNSLELFYRVEV